MQLFLLNDFEIIHFDNQQQTDRMFNRSFRIYLIFVLAKLSPQKKKQVVTEAKNNIIEQPTCLYFRPIIRLYRMLMIRGIIN